MHYVIKRTFDITFSMSAIIFLSPLMLVISLLICINMGLPIFFLQKRSGKDGTPFKIYKFRTMKNSKDKNGNLLSDEKRTTNIGQFLRKTSIDEIPELWNVLKGEMSIVGPRPLLAEYDELYSEEQKKRLSVLPGVTGLAQINGRNSITWEHKFLLDLKYIKDSSLLLDMKIIILTILKILKREGIMAVDGKPMPKFRGYNNKIC